MATPQNTPSAKKTADFSLKNVDFSKFLDNQNNFESNPIRHEREYCDPIFIGNSAQDIGYSENSNCPKVRSI
jgi:hypothetical protein